jgi:hypothetical protein
MITMRPEASVPRLPSSSALPVESKRMARWWPKPLKCASLVTLPAATNYVRVTFTSCLGVGAVGLAASSLPPLVIPEEVRSAPARGRLSRLELEGTKLRQPTFPAESSGEIDPARSRRRRRLSGALGFGQLRSSQLSRKRESSLSQIAFISIWQGVLDPAGILEKCELGGDEACTDLSRLIRAWPELSSAVRLEVSALVHDPAAVMRAGRHSLPAGFDVLSAAFCPGQYEVPLGNSRSSEDMAESCATCRTPQRFRRRREPC